MSYQTAAAIVADRDDPSGAHPPADPEERMHYAWKKLAKLTIELAVRNGTDLASIRDRIRDASDTSIAILQGAKRVA